MRPTCNASRRRLANAESPSRDRRLFGLFRHRQGPNGFFCLLIAGLLSPCLLSAQTPQQQQTEDLRYRGELITLSLRDADLVETLRNFAKIGNFNLVLDPAVEGKVTVELRNVPWDQALDQILKAHGLGTEIVGGQRVIAPPGALAEHRLQMLSMRTVELRLRHATATDVAIILQRPAKSESLAILTAEGSVSSREGNVLILRDRAHRLLRLGEWLQQVDRPNAEREDLAQLQARATDVWRHLMEAPAVP